ncbi:MAG: hypothetical protein KAS48_03535 [Gammaproteobacteria bacterium]|nr:hypothetical protein [Gammaproteobacteria bacterium]MCK5092136.1 hypothetical protein [Gammaproteobacteria bacterium]
MSAVSLLMALAIPVHGDELQMKSVGDEPENSPEGILRPTAGMSMEQVLQQFGEPQKMKGAVGDPPITRWIYASFIVYFEHKYVIHSVVPK